MIIKITPDKEKAESLRKMATITLERLKKTAITEYPSNTLVDYYNVIHKLLESRALINGIKAKGGGAHQELIDYSYKTKIINEETRIFLQQMRDHRNRISYEGFMIHKNYILLNKEKIEVLIKQLLKL